jgi:predicted short-subunit dehydrogenase-like oxidoreductase (DUF2520 family)
MDNINFDKKEISIIGAGRVGTTMSAVIAALNLPAININAVITRSSGSLDRAKKLIGMKAKNILFSRDMDDIPEKTNCIMICTPDDVIEKICRELMKKRKIVSSNVLLMHFSGAKSLDVFKKATSAGAFAVSLHPIKSFANIEESIKTIKGTVFGVTYSPNCTSDIKEFIDYFVRKLEGKIVNVDDEVKSIYHAAACVASNYLVALIDYAIRLNEAIGIEPQDSLKGLMGLIEGTVSNIKKLGSKRALTGPIARGDVGTIKEHIRSFQRNLKDESDLAYRIMGRQTSMIAYENGWIDKKTYLEFLKIFTLD